MKLYNLGHKYKASSIYCIFLEDCNKIQRKINKLLKLLLT